MSGSSDEPPVDHGELLRRRAEAEVELAEAKSRLVDVFDQLYLLYDATASPEERTSRARLDPLHREAHAAMLDAHGRLQYARADVQTWTAEVVARDQELRERLLAFAARRAAGESAEMARLRIDLGSLMDGFAQLRTEMEVLTTRTSS